MPFSPSELEVSLGMIFSFLYNKGACSLWQMTAVICIVCKLPLTPKGKEIGCCGHCIICTECLSTKQLQLPEFCPFTQMRIQDLDKSKLYACPVNICEGDYLCKLCGTTGALKEARQHFNNCKFKDTLCDIFSLKTAVKAFECKCEVNNMATSIAMKDRGEGERCIGPRTYPSLKYDLSTSF